MLHDVLHNCRTAKLQCCYKITKLRTACIRLDILCASAFNSEIQNYFCAAQCIINLEHDNNRLFLTACANAFRKLVKGKEIWKMREVLWKV